MPILGTLKAVATLTRKLDHPLADRARILTDHGLDETTWRRTVDDWVQQLDRAGWELIAQFTEAYRCAAVLDDTLPTGVAPGPVVPAHFRVLPFDEYLALQAELAEGRSRTSDALARFGIYERATYEVTRVIWSIRFAEDAALEERFAARLRRLRERPSRAGAMAASNNDC
jgi:hypothetical protein